MLDQALGPLNLARSAGVTYELHPDVRLALDVLASHYEAEPEASLLRSDYRYLIAATQRAQDTVRKHFHPVNPAVLEDLSKAIEALKVGVANTRV